MARIPEAEIERIKEQVSLERLVEASGVGLKRTGKDLFGRCPFHADDAASLSVTLRRTSGTASGRVTKGAMQMMRYGGHGAHVAMNHPIINALYLLPFPAFVGLYRFKNWGRYLFVAFVALALFGSFFFGVSISGPPETFFGYAASLLDGAIIGMAFLSPFKERFPKPASVGAPTL